jgi:hypothetical protein
MPVSKALTDFASILILVFDYFLISQIQAANSRAGIDEISPNAVVSINA